MTLLKSGGNLGLRSFLKKLLKQKWYQFLVIVVASIATAGVAGMLSGAFGAGFWGAVATGALSGAVGGAITGFVFSGGRLDGALKGAGAGAIAGGIGAGIGKSVGDVREMEMFQNLGGLGSEWSIP